MPQINREKATLIRDRGDASLALRVRYKHEHSPMPSPMRKRPRPENDDDFSSPSDSDGSSDLEDVLDSDWDINSAEGFIPPQLTKDLEGFSHQIANEILPTLLRYMESARYITPPTHRIPSRKRLKTFSSAPPRSLFLETQDPSDLSTILILRIHGYFPLACPCSISNPSLHGSCNLQHHLRSISEVVEHLIKHHPNPFYCPICSQSFPNEPICDSHIRMRACKPRRLDIVKGVSHSTLREIIRHDKPHLPEEDRWRRIYKILFPGKKPPERGAAYLSHGLPLAVAMARDYWEQQGRTIVGEYLARIGSDTSVPKPGDEGVSMLYDTTGKEVVGLVIAHYARKDSETGEVDDGSDEDRWVTVKEEQD
ncbi:hypothetical protein QBC41DRAFT_300324 [Cercophora samala]|uniref:C2H2-type domain-containing protein n=1 Tax=Cercophora samala TaxID=330535 RepID=A0AA39ZIF6_9PEZI|nr:hypothetical protein QBC41DRAFT_300324 [Cercophora samala]